MSQSDFGYERRYFAIMTKLRFNEKRGTENSPANPIAFSSQSLLYCSLNNVCSGENCFALVEDEKTC